MRYFHNYLRDLICGGGEKKEEQNHLIAACAPAQFSVYFQPWAVNQSSLITGY